MDNEHRVKEILKTIDKAFMELAELTGATHISAYCINGAVGIDDLSSLESGVRLINYYRRRNNE